MKMDASYNLITLQHELLMSIGAHTDPDEMLKLFSLKLIKALNLKRIYLIQKKNEFIEIEESVFSIPPTTIDFLQEHPKLSSFKNSFAPTVTNFFEEIEYEQGYIYCFGVKDLGYLFFERRLKPLDEDLLESLITPMNRFAQMYLSKQQFVLNIKQKEKIKKMSAILELDKLKFETILGAIDDGVIAINKQKEIIFANTSAYKAMGIEDKTELSKKYYEYFRLFSLDNTQDNTRSLEKLAIENTDWSVETPFIFKTKNTNESICEIKVQEIKDRRQKISFQDSYFVVTFHDITETYKMEQELAWQASHDHLTGCCNRAGFEKELNKLIERRQGNHALICMDLDNFKQVNDISGHQAGDALLKRITSLIDSEIRENDILARVGGDEFSIIAKNCDIETTKDMSERIRSKIEDFRFQWEDNVFSVGMSIGISEITPEDNDPEIIYFKADEACMQSKKNGRNQVTIAQQYVKNKTTARENSNYINFINKSLSANNLSFNFLLYQQSIKALSNNDTDHVEILLRMNYDGKIINPNAFIPTAERYGKITDIDLWVIKNSLEYLKENDITSVNVNLSGKTLNDDIAMIKLYELIAEHSENTHRLCLEITETNAITNLAKCIDFMEKTADLGVTFALDDFGTGVSSFGNLKNLPVKYLKIDGLFIKDICNNKIDQIVVRSIIEAATAMEIKTVAEYVENQSIYNKISKLGADFAQGYHINKPEELLIQH